VTEPTQTCRVCGRVVVVDFYARGFPPDAAKRKLVRLCKADGHKADPQYLAGYAITAPTKRPTEPEHNGSSVSQETES